jgi:hypothetical protein
MLLRRVSEAVRKQNWFTVLIELVVVVIGIVLALQLDQWKQEHELRQREQAVLARIGEELDAFVAHAERVVALSEHRVELATLVLNALRERRLDERDRDAFEDGLNALDVVRAPGWTLATVDELISSGELGLVRDAELRAGLVQLREQVRVANEALIHVRSEMSDYVPVVHLKLLFVPDSVGAERARLPGDRIFGSRVADYDFDALAADPEVVNAVGLSRRMLVAVAVNNAPALAQARRLQLHMERAR